MPCVEIRPLEDGLYQLALDDAAHGNRLTAEMIAGLIAALGTLQADPTVRAVIATGRRDVFCGGATREWLLRAANGPDRLAWLREEMRLIDALVNFPLPVVGALEGPAVGGGLLLALLLCDMLVVAEESRYGLHFTDMGFTPGMGATYLLPALTGYHVASEMLLGGKLYRGRELRGRGLFNEVVPVSDVWPVALDLARRVASKPRHVLEMLKETLATPRRAALPAALSRERLMMQICFDDPEVAAAVAGGYIG